MTIRRNLNICRQFVFEPIFLHIPIFQIGGYRNPTNKKGVALQRYQCNEIDFWPYNRQDCRRFNLYMVLQLSRGWI